MDRYEFVWKGITPILMHKDVVKQKDMPPDIGKPVDTLGDVDYSREWIATSYTSMLQKDRNVMDRTIAIPAHVIQAVLREGGAKIKIKGSRTAKSPIVAGFLLDAIEYPIFVNGQQITLREIEANDWIFFARARIRGARIDRVRAYVPLPWRLKIQGEIINPELSIALVTQIMEESGTKCGIGDWRPNADKPGSWGTFTLETYEKVK